jgi:hypothetical protein
MKHQDEHQLDRNKIDLDHYSAAMDEEDENNNDMSANQFNTMKHQALDSH